MTMREAMELRDWRIQYAKQLGWEHIEVLHDGSMTGTAPYDPMMGNRQFGMSVPSLDDLQVQLASMKAKAKGPSKIYFVTKITEWDSISNDGPETSIGFFPVFDSFDAACEYAGGNAKLVAEGYYAVQPSTDKQA